MAWSDDLINKNEQCYLKNRRVLNYGKQNLFSFS